MQDTMRQPRSFLRPGRSAASALVLCASILVLAIPLAAWSGEPEVVARVNGEAVTRGELQRMLADPVTRRQLQQELGARKADPKEVERLALRKLIIARLVLQEASRRKFTVSEDNLAQAVAALRRRFQDSKRFSAWLKARGLDDKSLRETIRADMLMSRVQAALVEGVRLTDEQVQEYYEAHKDDLKTSEEVRLRIIAVKDKAAAEEILAALKDGADFATLAKERSRGFRAAQGGDMGWVSSPRLPPPLREAVPNLKPGETGGPLRRGNEFLLVRLEDRRPPRTQSLDEARPQIERRLLSPKRKEVLEAWLADQEKNSKIEMFP